MIQRPVGTKVRPVKESVIGSRIVSDFSLGDIADWTEDGVRELAYSMLLDESNKQTRIGNKPTEFRVDGSINKSIDQMQRTAELLFGDAAFDARPAMEAIEALVKEVGPRTLRWEWAVRPGPNANKIARNLNGSGPVFLTYFDVLYFFPRGATEADIALLNIAYMEGRDYDQPGKLRKSGRPVTKSGFMASIARRGRRRISALRFTVSAKVSMTRATAIGRPLGAQNRKRRKGFRGSAWDGRSVINQGVWFLSLRKSVR